MRLLPQYRQWVLEKLKELVGEPLRFSEAGDNKWQVTGRKPMTCSIEVFSEKSAAIRWADGSYNINPPKEE